MHSTMKDYALRAGRTFLDTFMAMMVILVVPQLMTIVKAIATSGGGGHIDIDLNIFQNLILACIVAALAAVISGYKNRWEDTTGKTFIIPKDGSI